ncbi:MAG TPA: FMN-binding protein, partial [Anaerolineales bacterium]|nr:FMN-binding protein [Anaerolineales bacterium]
MLATLVAVVLAWVYGWLTAGFDTAPEALAVIPGATRVETRGTIYLGYDGAGQLVGYAGVGEAPGYGGPITLVVGVDLAGALTEVRVVQQRETPSFFRLLEREGYFDQFPGQPIDGRFQLGQGIDGVSGATFSAEGVAAATRQAIRAVASEGLGRTLPADDTPIRFGIPEVVLILLY